MRAEKYNNLTDEEKEKVQRIFIQLVRPGEGTGDTRRIAIKQELGEESWSLVKKLADYRLVVTSCNGTGQETVEVVHEALIRNWVKLRLWMNKDRVFRAWQERLRLSKRQWEEEDKDKGSLLRGTALAEAKDRLKERPDDLIAEKIFIEESIKEQERIEKREIRIAWSITIGSFIAALTISIFGWTASQKTKQAELNLADSFALTSLSLLAQGKDLDAVVAAIQAGKILRQYKAKDPQVMSALIAGIYESSESNRLDANDVVSSVSISSDGQTLVSGGGDGTIKIWNIDFDWLMERGCDRLHNYLLYNPTVKKEDKQLCEGIRNEEFSLFLENFPKIAPRKM